MCGAYRSLYILHWPLHLFVDVAIAQEWTITLVLIGANHMPHNTIPLLYPFWKLVIAPNMNMLANKQPVFMKIIYEVWASSWKYTMPLCLYPEKRILQLQPWIIR